jgi:predicted HTH transcriptional regulator
MISSIETLLQALRRGSLLEHVSDNVELKADWSEKYGHKLSALGNKTAMPVAWLVVGVTDKGQLGGKDSSWAKNREEVISQQINSNLDPVQACQGISSKEVDGSWILVIQIHNPGDVVYWGSNAYVAAGTTAKTMAPEEILQLRITLPGLSDYTAQEISSAYDSQLANDFATLFATEESSLEANPDASEILRRLGIYGRQAARLMLGTGSFRLIYYNHAGEPISNLRSKGLYRLLTARFQSDLQQWTRASLESTEPPYPPRALREALANAVAHAAYFENDGDIILELHPDHLVISNLCVQDSIYFANRWFSRSHKTINSLLMETLRAARLVDELGRGKNLIFSDSIRGGKRAPEVIIEGAGRYERWKLVLHGGTQDPIQIRLLDRTRAVYKDDQKALIANALVQWREKPVSEIRNYIDGDFARQFAEVLSSLNGPIWYHSEKDEITLTRWARVLLGDGQDSKGLSPNEERSLREFARKLQTQYHDSYISPADLRDLGEMGHTPSEKSLSCRLLAKWEREGHVKRVARGRYRFVAKGKGEIRTYQEVLRLLEG